MKRILFLVLFVCVYLKPVATTDIKPKVSIITSVYNGDDFIEGFLADIVNQTIFNQCELIIINADSPGNEEAIIKKYMTHYTNIRYIKLAADPGLYAVWNLGISLACADLITNANVDDRRNPLCLEMQAKALEEDSSVDLVYGDYYITSEPNETFEHNTHQWQAYMDEFSVAALIKCLPGPQPMWRKALHVKYGYFDTTFFSSGDYEMWLRAASRGSCFKKIPLVTGLYYINPQGLSTTADAQKTTKRDRENDYIYRTYNYLWQQ